MKVCSGEAAEVSVLYLVLVPSGTWGWGCVHSTALALEGELLRGVYSLVICDT